MAIQFAYGKYGKRAGNTWLEGTSSLSWACWARVDELESPVINQYLWSLYGTSSNYVGLKRDKTSGKFKVVVTQGGVTVTKEATATVTLGTTYHLAGSYQVNNATGLRLWINNAEIGTGSSTTTITGTLSLAGIADLWLSCNSYASNYGRCTLENFHCVRDHLWSTQDVEAIYYGMPASRCRWAGYEHWHLPLDQDHLTAFEDVSPGLRHVTTVVGAAAGGYQGLVDGEEDLGPCPPRRATTAGPPPPAAWTRYATRATHPDTAVVVAGLVDETLYEFRMLAVDEAANESAESDVVEATPHAYSYHSPRFVFAGR